MRKLTKDEFVEKAIKTHGNKYDYSKVEYVNAYTKVCIICPEHGEFWQKPGQHLFGAGCIKCAGKEKYTNESFIVKAKSIHGDRYDYSKVEYKNNKSKVCIICPEHGEFWQKAEAHINRLHGCPKCGGTHKMTTEDFIKKSELIHHFKYDYSKVEYINDRTKVCIICPEHGEFWQTPHAHLAGQRCPYCYGNIRLTDEVCIKRFGEIHGNKYRYNKFIYNGFEVKSCIICPEHGEFWQTPHAHLAGQCCPYCRGLYKTNDDIIREFKQTHGDRYDYSKVEYVNDNTKVCIICPEHGEFWQTPHNHLQGQGCPYCKSSKLENKVRILLKENNINCLEQKTFEWLKDKGQMYLDFYLPNYKIAIECHGMQHFKSCEYFGGEEGFKRRQELDFLKYDLCKQHGIRILYYSNINLPYFQKVESDFGKILEQIVK